MEKKSWREKFELKREPKVIDDKKGRGKMFIPTPLLIDGLVRDIPEGELATIGQIKGRLAKDFEADFTCPMTTGLFLKMVSETAEEDMSSGKGNISPYWRVVKDDGSLYDKFPGGVESQRRRLEKEGYNFQPGEGKEPPKVEGFKKHLHGF